MTDPLPSWRVVAVCAILVFIGLAGIFRVAALLRTDLTLFQILRREHAKRDFAPGEFGSRRSWWLYNAATWLVGAAGVLLLLLLVTRILGRMG